MPTITTETVFNGKPTLELKWKPDSPYPFSFGVGKAKLILASLDAIKAFVDRHKDDKSEPGAYRAARDAEGTPQTVNREAAYSRPAPTYERKEGL